MHTSSQGSNFSSVLYSRRNPLRLPWDGRTSMHHTQISTNQAPAAIGPYSQAIRCGQFVYASGQIALDPTSGELVGEDVQAMTAIYATYFTGVAPARSTVAVAELPRKALVEIECVAFIEGN